MRFSITLCSTLCALTVAAAPIEEYKRAPAAEAEAAHLVRLSPGAAMFKREAEAEADAEAEAAHLVRLSPGAAMFKREANAEAEAEADTT